MAKRLVRHLSRIVITLLIGGFLAATLVRFAPGFDTDEQQLDSRLSTQSLEAIRQSRAGEKHIFSFYWNFMQSAARGDFGNSRTLNRPVRELISERLPVSLKLIAFGLLIGWGLGLAFALTAATLRFVAYDIVITALAGLLLCIPSAVMGLVFVFANAPGSLAVGLIVFANVFRYWRNLLDKSFAMPHILAARARGLSPLRIMFWHVLPVSAAQMLAVAGISVSVALGAAVPIEALCGIPGIGQLAWQAALGRDLSLLVTLTLVVATITLLANTTSDLLGQAFRPQHA